MGCLLKFSKRHHIAITKTISRCSVSMQTRNHSFFTSYWYASFSIHSPLTCIYLLLINAVIGPHRTCPQYLNQLILIFFHVVVAPNYPECGYLISPWSFNHRLIVLISVLTDVRFLHEQIIVHI